MRFCFDSRCELRGGRKRTRYDSVMRFELSQQPQLRLGQQMKLSPRVLQSMELLQMPLAALEERIEVELESNVTLEQVEPSETAAAEERAAAADGSSETQSVGPAPLGAERFERAQEWHDRMGDDENGEVWREIARRDGEFDPRAAALASLPTRGESLEEILLSQWALCEATPQVMEAGRALLEYIGDDGFLVRPLDEIAATLAESSSSAPTLPLLTEALSRLQAHLEPTGIAARDLTESLLLQLAELESSHASQPAPQRALDARLLVKQYMHDLAQRRFALIRQKEAWSIERLDEAREVLRHLDPAPGRALKIESSPMVRADVIIEYDSESDAYTARLANGVLPNLRVSEEYLKIAAAKRSDPATKLLLTDGIRRARWFIDAIEQRGATLLRVVNVVIARQREWLETGGTALEPLPMTHVAREMKMNVSTISRAVAGKWIETPRGSFELRKLFAGGTETDSGSDISWLAVKAQVGEIIAAEDTGDPLSDQAIVDVLKSKGIPLARRTVVKYREQLGLPVARLRKIDATQ